MLALRNEVPAKALNTTFRGKPLEQIARETLKISRLGLLNRNKLNSEGHDETHFLAPLEEIVAAGITDAERMLKAYNSVWAGSVDPIFLNMPIEHRASSIEHIRQKGRVIRALLY